MVDSSSMDDGAFHRRAPPRVKLSHKMGIGSSFFLCSGELGSGVELGTWATEVGGGFF
jgi:hypothetical protein